MPAYITPALFTYLRALKKNNSREWFKKNQDRYETVLREPLRAFIRDFETPLAKISEHFIADDRKVGGSLFRIHKDVRFSKDKSPYKTHAGVHFRHEQAKDVHCPGFYLHLDPGHSFLGAGIWHPDAPTLKEIRDRIVEKPDAWKKVMRAKVFSSGTAALTGDSLSRSPRGYDKEHPLVDDLKRKDFIAVMPLTDKQACAPAFPKEMAKHFTSMRPLVGFVCDAIGVPC